MSYVHTCIEQLDLAAVQLHQNNPVYRRFALILIDNFIELLAHNHCEDIFAHAFPRGKYPKQIREEVLGRDFKKKMSFLQTLAMLFPDEHLFILEAHGYRNEAYHAGIVHDDILHALTWHYHRIACDLFARFRPGGRYNLSESPTETVQKHLGKAGVILVSDDDYANTARSLALARPLPMPDLPDGLARSALARIQYLEDTLAYMLKNDSKYKDRDDAVRQVQFWRDVFDSQPEGGYNLSDPAIALQWEQRVRFMTTEWKPMFSRCPIPSWKERANRLRCTSNLAHALQSFGNLGRDIDRFEVAVFGACAALDAHIDSLIEFNLEKRAGLGS